MSCVSELTAGNNSCEKSEAQLGMGLKSRMIFSETRFRLQRISMRLNKLYRQVEITNYKVQIENERKAWLREIKSRPRVTTLNFYQNPNLILDMLAEGITLRHLKSFSLTSWDWKGQEESEFISSLGNHFSRKTGAFGQIIIGVLSTKVEEFVLLFLRENMRHVVNFHRGNSEKSLVTDH